MLIEHHVGHSAGETLGEVDGEAFEAILPVEFDTIAFIKRGESGMRVVRAGQRGILHLKLCYFDRVGDDCVHQAGCRCRHQDSPGTPLALHC